MLTRQHYSAIAVILKHTTAWAGSVEKARQQIAYDLADYFEEDNPNFNRARFLKAASVELQSPAEREQ